MLIRAFHNGIYTLLDTLYMHVYFITYCLHLQWFVLCISHTPKYCTDRQLHHITYGYTFVHYFTCTVKCSYIVIVRCMFMYIIPNSKYT